MTHTTTSSSSPINSLEIVFSDDFLELLVKLLDLSNLAQSVIIPLSKVG